MFYKKPNIRYVDMAIYIDNNIYREDLTEEEKNTVFIYMYHLIHMLAVKGKLFNSAQYYDDFSIYMATFVYLRYLNKKQYELDADGNPKMSKLKSVLNYIKKTIRVRKIDFEQSFYSQSLSKKPDILDNDACFTPQYTLAYKLANEADRIKVYNFEDYFNDIPAIARNLLNKTPYANDKSMIENIYLSCMLTILNSITVKNSVKQKRVKYNYAAKCTPNDVILYHLPSNMNDYIFILSREIKHLVAKGISRDIHTYIQPSDLFENIMLEELGGDSLVENKVKSRSDE